MIFAFIVALFVWLLFQIPSGIIFTCLGVVAGFYGIVLLFCLGDALINPVKPIDIDPLKPTPAPDEWQEFIKKWH